MNTINNDSEQKLEKCDGCNDWFPLRELTIREGLFVCRKCLASILDHELDLRMDFHYSRL